MKRSARMKNYCALEALARNAMSASLNGVRPPNTHPPPSPRLAGIRGYAEFNPRYYANGTRANCTHKRANNRAPPFPEPAGQFGGEGRGGDRWRVSG